jgi:hypothetical protein
MERSADRWSQFDVLSAKLEFVRRTQVANLHAQQLAGSQTVDEYQQAGQRLLGVCGGGGPVTVPLERLGVWSQACPELRPAPRDEQIQAPHAFARGDPDEKRSGLRQSVATALS